MKTVKEMAVEALGWKGNVTVIDSTDRKAFLKIDGFMDEYIIINIDTVNWCLYNGNYSYDYSTQSIKWKDIKEEA